MSDVGPREVRLHSRTCFGDERDGAGRRNRRRLIVARRDGHVFGDANLFAQEAVVCLLVRLVFGEDSLLRAEAARLDPGLASHEAHRLVHQINRGVRAVLDLQLHAEVCEAHDAEADGARALHHVVNFRERPRARVDHVVEEAHAPVDCVGQSLPVETRLRVVELRKVNRAEVARVVEMKRLLRARVRRVDGPHRIHHVVVAVDLINEDDARLCVAVRRGDDAVPDVRRVNHPDLRRLLARAAFKQARLLRLRVGRAVAERDGLAVGATVDGVCRVLHGVEDRLVPRPAVERELEPLLFVNGLEELVGRRH